MKLHTDPTPGSYRITAYGPGYLTINDEHVAGSIIITAERLIIDWPAQVFNDLDETNLNAVLPLNPEIVLIGTGNRQQFPQASALASLLSEGIGIEIMDTAAACRTFNILMSERRNVAAMLLPMTS